MEKARNANENRAIIASKKWSSAHRTWAILHLAVVALIFLTSSEGRPAANADTHEFPANVTRALDLEIDFNPGLDSYSLQRMAAAVLSRTTGVTFEEARNQAKRKSKKELQSIIKLEFPIEFVEVPVRVLEKLGDVTIKENSFHKNPELAAIRFNKDGIEMVRSFIHPLNEKSAIEKALEAAQMSFPRRSGEFTARLTSSRSVYVINKNADSLFSIKLSLPQAMGLFKDKSYLSRHAQFHLMMSELIEKHNQLHPDSVLDFQVESGFTAFKKGNQFEEAQLVRKLDGFANGGLDLTAAAIFGGNLGLRIAELNGSKDVKDFWSKNLIAPLATLTGRMAANLDSYHNSLHSQNIVIRLDSEMKVIGVRLRDPDLDLISDSLKRKEYSDIISIDQIPKSNWSEKPRIKFSLLNGIPTYPSWLPAGAYKEWINQFAELSAATYSHIRKKIFTPTYGMRAVVEQISNSWLNSASAAKNVVRTNGHYSVELEKLDSPDAKTGSPEEIKVSIEEIRNKNRADFMYIMNFYAEQFPQIRTLLSDPAGLAHFLISNFPGDTITHIAGKPEGEFFKEGFERLFAEYVAAQRTRSRDSRLHKIIDTGTIEQRRNLIDMKVFFTETHDGFLTEILRSLPDLSTSRFYFTKFHSSKSRILKKATLTYVRQMPEGFSIMFFFENPDVNYWHQSPEIAKALIERVPIQMLKDFLDQLQRKVYDRVDLKNFPYVREYVERRIDRESKIPKSGSTKRFQNRCMSVFGH